MRTENLCLHLTDCLQTLRIESARLSQHSSGTDRPPGAERHLLPPHLLQGWQVLQGPVLLRLRDGGVEQEDPGRDLRAGEDRGNICLRPLRLGLRDLLRGADSRVSRLSWRPLRLRLVPQ